MKDYAIERVQGGDLIDNPLVVLPGKNIARRLLEDVLTSARGPYRFGNQFPAVAAAPGGDDFLLMDGPHFFPISGLDRIRVIPEIESIYVTVVEPNSRVVRVVDPLTRTRRQGKSPDNVDPV